MFFVSTIHACTPEETAIAIQTAGDATRYVSDGIVLVAAMENTTSHGWTRYKQCDSRWGHHVLGTCEQTICASGSAMSSVAMILRTKGVDINPLSFNSWLDKNSGYSGNCNLIWSKADSFGKTKFQGISKGSESSICVGLKKGHGIVANVRNGAHWALITACLGEGVFAVIDPGFHKTSYTMREISQEAIFYDVAV